MNCFSMFNNKIKIKGNFYGFSKSKWGWLTFDSLCYYIAKKPPLLIPYFLRFKFLINNPLLYWL